MSLYKCLYLLPEEEYRKHASGSTSVVEGIGGSVSDSHVNKIEVNHGGSVVIDKHSNCGGKAAAAAADQSGVPPRPAAVQELPSLPVSKKGSTKETARLDKPTAGRDLAAKSVKLKKGKKAPNAFAARNVPSRDARPTKTRPNASERVVGKDGSRSVASDSTKPQWEDEVLEEPMDVDQLAPSKAVPARPTARQLEKVIARKNAVRSQKEKEKMLLDTLKVAKVKELQGAKGKREVRNDREQEREIVHQLRDIYRDELKKGAAREKSGPRTVLDSGDLQGTKSGGSGRTSVRDRLDVASGGKKRRKDDVGEGKSLTPSLALAALENGVARTLEAATATPASHVGGAKRPARDDWPSSSTKRQKGLPKPWLIRQKRSPSPSWDEPSRVKRAKSVPKPWLIREKRAASDDWLTGERKKAKGPPKPWSIREKRRAPTGWGESRKKRGKKDDESDTTSDSDDSSDDGNGGKYKLYLDSIARSRKIAK